MLSHEMIDEIVSFEVARELSKIEDFTDNCYFGYVTEFNKETNDYDIVLYLKEYPGPKNNVTKVSIYRDYLAPTIQHLKKWLAKNKAVTYTISYNNDTKTWKGECEIAYDEPVCHISVKNAKTYESVENNILFNVLTYLSK